MTAVKISAKSMRQPFHGCAPDYIANVCRGACCRRSIGGILVSVHPAEAETVAVQMRARGGAVHDGRVIPAPERPNRCPAQTDANLCALHGTAAKPFGCIASPFTLSSRDTLIVRNRYRLLRCYRDGDVPAYRAFSGSLVHLFGAATAAEIGAHLDGGGGDLVVEMPDERAATLRYLDHTKKGTP